MFGIEDMIGFLIDGHGVVLNGWVRLGLEEMVWLGLERMVWLGSNGYI